MRSLDPRRRLSYLYDLLSTNLLWFLYVSCLIHWVWLLLGSGIAWPIYRDCFRVILVVLGAIFRDCFPVVFRIVLTVFWDCFWLFLVVLGLFSGLYFWDHFPVNCEGQWTNFNYLNLPRCRVRLWRFWPLDCENGGQWLSGHCKNLPENYSDAQQSLNETNVVTCYRSLRYPGSHPPGVLRYWVYIVLRFRGLNTR